MKRIKKCLLFLFLIMLFIPFTVKKAEAKASCSDVKDAVNQLEAINNDIKTLKCDEATTDKLLAQCNKLAVNKASVLESIFEYNEDKICPSIKLNSIIDEYSDDCTEGFTSSVKAFADSVMNFFYITAPFILIIFGSLDFFKIVAGASPEEIKKHRQNFVKRLIAFLLLYITPFFVKTIFSITPYNIDGADYVCSQEISFTPKLTSEAITGYYSEDNYGGGGDSGKRIAEAAKQIKQNAINNKYSYGCNHTGITNVGTKKTDHMCCADLISAAVYKAGIYDAKKAQSLHSGFAADMADNLLKNGDWKVVDKKDLKPGDVILWECEFSGCNKVYNVKGGPYRVGHVDIYYGNGKKVSTGGSFKSALSNYTTRFCDDGKCKHVLCGIRYVGKK